MEPYGNTIFCDDIRFEQQSKFSLIGCYGYELIIFAPMPASIPKLCMLVSVRLPSIRSVPPLKFNFYFPGISEPTPSIDFAPPKDQSFPPINDSDVDPVIGVTLPFLFGPVTIQEEGWLKVRVEYDDKIIKVGALKITSRTAQT